MSQDHNPEQQSTTDGQASLRECPSFESLSLYFDEAVEADEAARIGVHVAGCASCQAALQDMRLIRQALKQTTPAPSQRTIRLTEADVGGDRPVRRSGASAPTTLARRAAMLTLPFLPALTAVAALLLIAVIAGDLYTGDNDVAVTPTAGSSELVLPDGTVIPVTDEDLEGNFGGASESDMSPGDANGSAQNETADSGDEAFWSWWRIGEVLLAAILIGLVAAYLFQRRSRRA
jgi:hypothetical protein